MRRRREFLRGAAAMVAVACAPAGAAGAGPKVFLPNLGHHVGVALVRVARDIYPHDRIPDSLYLQALFPYDTAAAKDYALKQVLTMGVADLDSSAFQIARCRYSELPEEGGRIAILKQHEHGAFFRRLQADLLYALYNNKTVWHLLGYEGSSWEKGGYLHRGFDDIDWISS